MNDADKLIVAFARKLIKTIKPDGVFIDNQDFYKACSFIRLTKKDAKVLRKALTDRGIIELANDGRKKGIRVKGQTNLTWSWKLTFYLMVGMIAFLCYYSGLGLS